MRRITNVRSGTPAFFKFSRQLSSKASPYSQLAAVFKPLFESSIPCDEIRWLIGPVQPSSHYSLPTVRDSVSTDIRLLLTLSDGMLKAGKLPLTYQHHEIGRGRLRHTNFGVENHRTETVFYFEMSDPPTKPSADGAQLIDGLASSVIHFAAASEFEKIFLRLMKHNFRHVEETIDFYADKIRCEFGSDSGPVSARIRTNISTKNAKPIVWAVMRRYFEEMYNAHFFGEQKPTETHALCRQVFTEHVFVPTTHEIIAGINPTTSGDSINFRI